MFYSIFDSLEIIIKVSDLVDPHKVKLFTPVFYWVQNSTELWAASSFTEIDLLSDSVSKVW